MSVDTVNTAVTAVRLRIGYDQSGAYSPEGKAKLLNMLGVMRMYLMEEKPGSFDAYIDNALASEPDAMSYLLDEIFAELGFPEGIREQLSAELAA
jgi:hypothetical protein